MKRSYRRVILLIALACWVIAGAWIAVDCLVRPRFAEGPMVQLVRPDGFSLVWRGHPMRESTLVVQTPEGQAAGTIKRTITAGRDVAEVRGLLPGRKYVYRVTLGGASRFFGAGSIESPVRTAPPAGTPFRVLAFGDSGDGLRPQRRLARLMPRYSPDLMLHTGDLVYFRGETKYYPKRFYWPYEKLLLSTPFYGCLGNHDVIAEGGRPWLDNFVLPENGPAGEETERNYWFDYAGTRFVALDTNSEHIEDRSAPWLESVLSDAGERWKVVFFHEPVFTHSKHTPSTDVGRFLIPVIERHHVALVLCGHNHLYERSHPLRESKPVAAGAGTVYVTTGAGGAKLYSIAPRRPEFMAHQVTGKRSFTLIDIAADQMLLQQINEQGEPVDRSVIPRPVPAATRTGA